MVNCVVGTLKPPVGVIFTSILVRLRGVENPVTVTENPVIEVVTTRPEMIVGATAAIENCKTLDDSEVRVKPSWVENEGVKVIVAAAVPVWRRI